MEGIIGILFCLPYRDFWPHTSCGMVHYKSIGVKRNGFIGLTRVYSALEMVVCYPPTSYRAMQMSYKISTSFVICPLAPGRYINLTRTYSFLIHISLSQLPLQCLPFPAKIVIRHDRSRLVLRKQSSNKEFWLIPLLIQISWPFYHNIYMMIHCLFLFVDNLQRKTGKRTIFQKKGTYWLRLCGFPDILWLAWFALNTPCFDLDNAIDQAISCYF